MTYPHINNKKGYLYPDILPQVLKFGKNGCKCKHDWFLGADTEQCRHLTCLKCGRELCFEKTQKSVQKHDVIDIVDFLNFDLDEMNSAWCDIVNKTDINPELLEDLFSFSEELWNHFQNSFPSFGLTESNILFELYTKRVI